MKLKWKMLIAFASLYALGIIGVGMHTYDASKAMSSTNASIETLKIVFIMLGGLGVILPTYLNVWQSLETANLLQEQFRRNEIENTMKIIERWDDKHFLEARKFTRKLKDQHATLSPEQLKKEINENPDLRQSVILIFNYFDYIRLSIINKRIDAKVIVSQFGEVFHDMHDRFSPWLKDQPKDYQADLKILVKLFNEHARG